MSLALICGQGRLPRLISDAQPSRPLVCVLAGFEPEALVADIRFSLETLGTLLADLRRRGVDQVCLCGSIRRPPIDPGKLDAATIPLVPRMQQALTTGDDGALRIVMEIFSEVGLTVVGAHELLPDLLPRPGVLTLKTFKPRHEADARVGEDTVAIMGARDAGQACVIHDQRVVAREDAAGTDAMLARLSRDGGALPADGRSAEPGMFADIRASSSIPAGEGAPGGILFKAPKPDQDRRADLPVIGVGTAEAVAVAGLAGLVIEAGGVMILDRARTVARCDALGLFLWVREKGA